MFRILVVLVLLFATSLPAATEAPAASDRAAFESVITQQLEAFRADDGARAYSYAAPNIRQIFPTSEIFMAMVKRGYLPVYRAQGHRFGATVTDSLGQPAQRVTLTGPDGKLYEALYSMQRQPDGTWRISGCTLLEVPGLDA